MKRAVIDRFEGEWAVLVFDDGKTTLNVAREQLPQPTREGDHLLVEVKDGAFVAATVDDEAKQAAQKRIESKLSKLQQGDHLADE